MVVSAIYSAVKNVKIVKHKLGAKAEDVITNSHLIQITDKVDQVETVILDVMLEVVVEVEEEVVCSHLDIDHTISEYFSIP